MRLSIVWGMAAVAGWTAAVLLVSYSVVHILRGRLTGWARVAWITAMVGLPLVGALTYQAVAARTPDVDRRTADGRVDARRAPLATPPPLAVADELTSPPPSREDGRLTAAQFDGLTRPLVRF